METFLLLGTDRPNRWDELPRGIEKRRHLQNMTAGRRNPTKGVIHWAWRMELDSCQPGQCCSSQEAGTWTTGAPEMLPSQVAVHGNWPSAVAARSWSTVVSTKDGVFATIQPSTTLKDWFTARRQQWVKFCPPMRGSRPWVVLLAGHNHELDECRGFVFSNDGEGRATYCGPFCEIHELRERIYQGCVITLLHCVMQRRGLWRLEIFVVYGDVVG